MGKVFLITGGTGSLGTVLTQHLLKEGNKVRVLARNEHGHEKLKDAIPQEHHSRLSCQVGDVRDKDRLIRASKGVDVLIHAAAMKIIHTGEYNPEECVRTNVLGTMSVIDAALECDVKRAVLVSSDKAVSPANLYGSTKMCAERLWLHSNYYCGAKEGKFIAVRYGNVWASNGSVIHKFMHQAQTGTLSLTHRNMTRFSITLDQAIRWVLMAVDEAKPGEIRVPKLPSYNLTDLAAAIAPEAEITFTGARPGEKLAEEMVGKYESCYAVETRDGYTITPGMVSNEGGWTYDSGNNTWRMSREMLKEQINGWIMKGPVLYT